METNCKKIIPLLNEYLDDELDIETSSFVNSHLQECFNCNNELNQLKSTVDQLKILKNITIENSEPDLSLSIISKIKKDIQVKSSKKRINLKYIAASILIIALSIYGILDNRQKLLESSVNISDDHLLSEYANDYYSMVHSNESNFYSYDLNTFSDEN